MMRMILFDPNKAFKKPELTMEKIVIVAYKPLPGKTPALEKLIKTHWDVLNKEGLVSDRKPILCKAKDGTIVEVFGWKSKEAIESAHANESVQKMWTDYAEVCEYIPISEVAESMELFSEFMPV